MTDVNNSNAAKNANECTLLKLEIHKDLEKGY